MKWNTKVFETKQKDFLTMKSFVTKRKRFAKQNEKIF